MKIIHFFATIVKWVAALLLALIVLNGFFHKPSQQTAAAAITRQAEAQLQQEKQNRAEEQLARMRDAIKRGEAATAGK